MDLVYGDFTREAVTCELENAGSPRIAEFIDCFPRDEIGVVQGCCLSPLFGNILLNSFDKTMNSKSDVCCLRYIDDFLIVGKDRGSVMRAADNAVNLLRKLGLEAYSAKDKEKSEFGLLRNGVVFLGCKVWPGRIQPAKKAVNRLLEKVSNALGESLFKMRSIDNEFDIKYSLTHTMHSVSNTVKGWGNSFSFCADDAYMDSLDREINDKIMRYLEEYAKIKSLVQEQRTKTRILGIHLLSNCKKDPIYEKSKASSR